MENLFSYLKKYGNTGFLEKEFNDIDAGILSLIPYFNFTGIIPHDKTKLKLSDSLLTLFANSDLKSLAKQGFMNRDLIKLGKKLIDSFRYRDILVYGYNRILNDEEQFSGMTFLLPSGEKIISFEGTGPELVGWEEDFAFSYCFPCPAQKDAIKYVKRNTSIFDKDIIIVGHSKGGNLALVSSMYTNFLIKRKIKKIYSFDGPGLRKKEINSKKYHSIEDKLVHLIPNYSIVGLLLLHNDSFRVIKSNRIDLYAHSLFTWCIEDDKWFEGKLSRLSKNLDKSVVLWLEKHPDESREKIVKAIFKFLKDAGITDAMQLKEIKTIITLIKKRKDLDEETREVLSNFVAFNVDYYKNNQ